MTKMRWTHEWTDFDSRRPFVSRAVPKPIRQMSKEAVAKKANKTELELKGIMAVECEAHDIKKPERLKVVGGKLRSTHGAPKVFTNEEITRWESELLAKTNPPNSPSTNK
jgi:hypothetical protein